jgi:hypothetical protein
VLVQAYAPALALYPETEWLEVEERHAGHDAAIRRPDVGAVGDVERGGSGAGCAGPDPDPGGAAGGGGAGGQALLVGAINKVEIWNPAKFEAAVRARRRSRSSLARDIFR